uniref:Uncharacterized protein n=1 Tax=Arundo donax TaxID=35708 RepID=A0A0A9D5C4_ARUDO
MRDYAVLIESVCRRFFCVTTTYLTTKFDKSTIHSCSLNNIKIENPSPNQYNAITRQTHIKTLAINHGD